MDKFTANDNRIDFLDVSRGVGILLVVMGHVIGEGNKTFTESDSVYAWIYSFHMPLFFIISGILLGLSLSKNTGDKYEKKTKSLIRHLLIPYFLWTAVYFILDSRSLNSFSYLAEWLVCTISFRGKAPIWFAGALFWAELAALFICRFTEKKDRCDNETKAGPHIQQKSLLLITAAVFFLSAIVWSFYNHNLPENQALDYFEIAVFRGVLCLGFVLAGLLLQKTGIIFNDSKKTTVFFAVMTLAGLFLFCRFNSGTNLHTFSIGNIYVFIASGTAGSLAVLELSKFACRRFRLNMIKTIGKNSMGIMCLHYVHLPFMNYASEICSCLNVTGFAAFLFTFVFVMSCSLLGSMVLKGSILL